MEEVRKVTDKITINETAIKDLITLLSDEIASINSGNLDRVIDLYAQKAELLDIIQTDSPEIQKQLEDKTDATITLRSDLINLHDLVHKNAQLLADMTEATRGVIQEIARIRNRHGLGGLYKPDGEKHPQHVPVGPQLNQSI